MEKLILTKEEADAATEALLSAAPSTDVKAVLDATLDHLAQTLTEPRFGTIGGEWSVFALARGGYYPLNHPYFQNYYRHIEETVEELASKLNQNDALHRAKSTENSRLILTLTSLGIDATQVGKRDLTSCLNHFDFVIKQGINGPIWALIALDSHNYKTENPTLRQQCIDYILDHVLPDGGWALSGTISDPDITAMALQALANYKDQPLVKDAADKAFAWLSSAQKENGGFSSWGTVNSESIAQVIVACTAWGVHPDTDARFIKNGLSPIDALLRFRDEKTNMFRHIKDGTGDAMATDQALLALLSYRRMVTGKTFLYDLDEVFEKPSDLVPPGSPSTPGTPSPDLNRPSTTPDSSQTERNGLSPVAVALIVVAVLAVLSLSGLFLFKKKRLKK